ncbi:MAG: DUF3592 domain-containing protein [Alphaproteobacteria bacterium]|nr:DUF3592 domain-containing protein [Alphaproteobacteria bacterium]
MFDMTFDAMMAFHQAGFLLGGGICALIGAAILLHTLHTYLRALRVPAIITGVRRSGDMLYPVYKYMMPSGDIFETVSDTGSNFVKGKETGREVTLYVFENDPQGIRTELRVAVLIGLVFLVPGLVLLGNGIFAFPFTPMTWIAAGIFLLMAAQRIRKAFLPQGARGGKNTFRAHLRARRNARLEKMELTTIEAYLQTPAGRQMLADTEQSRRIGLPLLLVFGVVLLGFSWHTGAGLRDLTLHGQRAAGVIEKFDTKSTGDGTTVYRAHITFNDALGEPHRFAEKTAASHPRHRVGDAVTVLYAPHAPADTAIVDDGIWMNALWPALLALGGLAMLWGALRLWRAVRAAEESR